MFILDENKLRMLHNLMREKGVINVDVSMFEERQRKIIYESYGEKFLFYSGMAFMVNCVISYALAKNIEMVNKKLREELDYAFKAHDYDYALLCSKLLRDQGMTTYLRNYTQTDKYENLFNSMNKFILEAKNDSVQ
ncbi:MAG: hypothetical protein AABW56_00420 [Nanoarchaeota archaeon]